VTAQETTATIETADGVTLDGRLTTGEFATWAVLCHPHPLYGGTMDNNVVCAARDALADAGVGSLRFNFRGVGRSTGRFEDGVGEALDVAAACSHLRSLGGAEKVYGVAYSFGAWVFSRAVTKGLPVDGAVLVSPPVTFIDFSDLTLPDAPCLIVVGDRDEFCSLSDLDQWLDSQPARSQPLEKAVLNRADHFYLGCERALKSEIQNFLR
jgi:alpha/beta superfamily hydrolase